MSNFSEGHKGTTHGEFSVCQFFKEGWDHEYTRRFVGAEEATDAFFHYCTSVGARLGWTVRVIITDGLDSVNMEWTHAEGITFPAEHRGKLKPGSNDAGRGSGVRESSAIPNPADGSGRADKDERVHGVESVESEASPEAREGSRGDDAADEG